MAAQQEVLGDLSVNFLLGLAMGWVANTMLLLGFLGILIVPPWLAERRARKTAVRELLSVTRPRAPEPR